MSQQETVCRQCGTASSGAKFCPECGASVQADQTQATNGPPPKSVPLSTADSSPATLGAGGKAARLWTVLWLALVLALAGVGVGVAGFVTAHNAQSSANRLRSQVSATHQQLATALGTISNLKANSQTGAVTALQAEMSKLTTCIPELQQEINGLNVSTSNTNGYLTNAFLQNQTIVSKDCSKTLNGS